MAKGKIVCRTEDEIALIRESSLIVSKTLGELSKHIAPGISTLNLDTIAETFIRDHGAVPAFKNYQASFSSTPFPYTLCISLNEVVVHGFPSEKRILQEGDIVSVDCGVVKNGYYGDSAYTFPVGEINARKRKLLEVTRQSLYKGVEKAVAGNRLGEISNAIQRHVETYGFSIVREMVGHGLGTQLHEAPDIPNFGKRFSGPKLEVGMVMAIEPMVNLGKRFVETAEDGWTIYAKDMQPSAHFEHSVVVGKDKVDILTTFDFIESTIKV